MRWLRLKPGACAAGHSLNAQNSLPSGSAMIVQVRVPCRGSTTVAPSARRPARSLA